MTPSTVTPNRLRFLNDAFRTSGFISGRWFLTRGVVDMGPEFVALAIRAVLAFDGFTPDNDPYGEHDFGSFNLAGQTMFWKIDYYDAAFEHGSDDPSDPRVTCRALTILLASEY